MNKLWGRSAWFTAAVVATVAISVATATAGAIDLGTPLYETPRFAISPSRLPGTQPAQVRMSASESYRISDGSHVPALEELEIKGDRHLALELDGASVCSLRGYDPRGSIEEQCRDALVGRGKLTVEVAFPEEPLLWVRGRLSLYNGGRTEHGRRLVAAAFLSAPVTAELTIPFLVEKLDKGRFGWRAKAKVPKIAGNSGSIFGYSMRIGKRFLRATCADGRFEFGTVSTFADGSQLFGRVTRPCSVAEPHVGQ